MPSPISRSSIPLDRSSMSEPASSEAKEAKKADLGISPPSPDPPRALKYPEGNFGSKSPARATDAVIGSGPLLGSSASLGRDRPQAFETFLSSTKRYTEHRYPGSKTLLRAILEQGLAHVTDGSKPAYMGYESLRDDQGDLAGILGMVSAGCQLNSKFAVVKYSADNLCTGSDACFVINKHAMSHTIASNAAALGIGSDSKSVRELLKQIVGGRASIFKDEVALGILLGLGEANSRKYVQRNRELEKYKSLDDAQFNAKVGEIDSNLGTSTIQHSMGSTIAQMDITMPRPWLGSVWDSKETERIAKFSIQETRSIDSGVRRLHALKQDADASYADTLIEYVVGRLYT